MGGELRAIGDIGSHWMDLAQFVTRPADRGGLRRPRHHLPVRQRPLGEVETFASADDVERVDEPMATEDFGHVLAPASTAARGARSRSPRSAPGRKNHLQLRGRRLGAALAWNSERHEELWIGHRDEPNERAAAQPALMQPDARPRHVPPGRPRRGVRRHVPRALPRRLPRRRGGGPPAEPDYPTFADGTARTCSAMRSPQLQP